MMLNQFPCESLVTVKDCMAAVSRRVVGGVSPAWLPETFNLQTELPQFIANYQRRQKRSDYFSHLKIMLHLKGQIFCYIFARKLGLGSGPRTCILGLCKKMPVMSSPRQANTGLRQ